MAPKRRKADTVPKETPHDAPESPSQVQSALDLLHTPLPGSYENCFTTVCHCSYMTLTAVQCRETHQEYLLVTATWPRSWCHNKAPGDEHEKPQQVQGSVCFLHSALCTCTQCSQKSETAKSDDTSLLACKRPALQQKQIYAVTVLSPLQTTQWQRMASNSASAGAE